MICDRCNKEIEDTKKCEMDGCSIPKNTDYDVEDLDPDKRSWYYDGYGVKRKRNDV